MTTANATTRMPRKDSAKGQPCSGVQAKSLPNSNDPIGSGYYCNGDDPAAPCVWWQRLEAGSNECCGTAVWVHCGIATPLAIVGCKLEAAVSERRRSGM